MNADDFGNNLNRLVGAARSGLFEQGELAQLTYGAFDIAVRTLSESEEESITIEVPIGYRPDRQTMLTSRRYGKDELLGRYQFLAFQQLAVNGLAQLVTIVEALFGDILRAVVMKYPKKLGAKRSLTLEVVFGASSIIELHLKAADQLLNELAYKSPAEFAESFESLTSINLLECAAYHKYTEGKATRDIYVHNRGIANEIYARKAASHSRAAAGTRLPVDLQYFLEMYEVCLQLTEWLEARLHEHWYSSEHELNKEQLIFSLEPPGLLPPPPEIAPTD